MNRQRCLVVAILALSWLICLALTLTEPVDRDEHMYQAAAALLGDSQLYEDVAFLQPPYMAWVYAGWQRLAPGEQILLSARIFKALLALALLLVLHRLLRRLGASDLLAALLVLLLVHLETVRGMVGVARNYDLAQLVVLAAFLVLPLRSGDAGGRVRLVIAGLLAGVAVGLKLTYLAPALVVVGWPLIAPVALPAGRRDALWTAAGALLGLAPVAILLLTTDLAAVRFNLVDYHLLNATWNQREGLGLGLDLAGKLHEARHLYRDTDNAVLLLLAVVAVGLAIRYGRGSSRTVWSLVLWLLAAGVVMVAVPRPIQPAYFAPLLVAVTLMVAAAAVCLEGRPRQALTVIAAVACLVSVVHHGGDDLHRLGRLGAPHTWPAVRLHEAGRVLAELTAHAPDQAVVTTHPLYALEAGRPLAPEFATGEFAWRLGDLLDADTQRRFHLVTPGTLADLLATRPPSAVVVEAVGPWDEPLAGWARGANWRPASVVGGVLAWLPRVPSGQAPPDLLLHPRPIPRNHIPGIGPGIQQQDPDEQRHETHRTQ